MPDNKYLYEEIPYKAYNLGIARQSVPEFISDNLKYELFDWQREALESFLTYDKIKEAECPGDAAHLLFNMATGTGKTLLMAALMLYYYEKGYRHFLFFVNQNNIVGKTEDNLTEPSHNKYLFKNPIVINDKTIRINKVDYFSDASDEIQILFTSIHKLHNAVYQVKENAVFLNDLQDRDIVMLADEAHHLNADTKAKAGEQSELDIITELAENASAKEVEKSWEHTVTKLILNRQGREGVDVNRNVLLEFTATVPEHKNIIEKYRKKTIYRFDLKDFLKAGYTKEINLVSSSFDRKQRILQALLFNWYRCQIGVKYGLSNFKPVILFRSKFVDEAKEENVRADYNFFRDIIDNLCAGDFDFLKNIEKEKVENVYSLGQSRIVDIFNYIEKNDVSFASIIGYMQDAFKYQNCIITHSKEKEAKGRRGEDKTTPEQDKLLNSLEDKNNHITAVFTCQRLTEGWDVLNLYDIIRMYEGQNTGGKNKGKAGKSTTSEVQLIGRGVRYYPFVFEDGISNKRKFDNSLDHELRVLEEFYFHSDKDERYIAELKNELKRQDLLPEKDKKLKIFDIKKEIKEDLSSFYHQAKLYINYKLPNPDRRKQTLQDLKETWSFEDKIHNVSVSETKIVLDKKDDITRLNTDNKDGKTIKRNFKDIRRNIVLKALNIQAKKDHSILKFSNLREDLSISSIDDIFTDEYLGLFELSVVVPDTYNSFDEIPANEQVRIVNNFLVLFANELKKISNPYIGSEFKPVDFKEYFRNPKIVSVTENPENDVLEEELVRKDWYALNAFHGTSEERHLVNFLKGSIENFKDKFERVYLLRNEEVYKIYDFEKGNGFMPDFLMFLKSPGKNQYYQIFIEPKGSQFKDASGGFGDSKEGWKERFLEQITQKYSVAEVLITENKEYRIVGLPLYNNSNKVNFKKSIKDNLGIDL